MVFKRFDSTVLCLQNILKFVCISLYGVSTTDFRNLKLLICFRSEVVRDKYLRSVISKIALTKKKKKNPKIATVRNCIAEIDRVTSTALYRIVEMRLRLGTNTLILARHQLKYFFFFPSKKR